jgi:hypothetical protein
MTKSLHDITVSPITGAAYTNNFNQIEFILFINSSENG